MIKTLKTLLILFVAITLPSSISFAQAIRDMSLSVARTNQQLATPQKPKTNNRDSKSLEEMAGFDNDPHAGFDDNMVRQIDDINNRYDNSNNQSNDVFPLPSSRRGQNGQGFINKFCSSSYKAKAASNTIQQECMEDQRQQACDRFNHATVNVQKILSQAIDCELSSTNFSEASCDGLDASRLDLLKQYWQDEDISYTILYLPDMVINSAGNCSSAKHNSVNGNAR